MFTGIVEEVGALRAVSRSGPSARLCIRAAKVLEGTQIGDSIAVNGGCLTVTELGGEGFWADVMHETLDRSALGSLRPGDPVNLEADIIGKYVEKLLGLPAPQSAKETGAGALSLDMLTRCGF